MNDVGSKAATALFAMALIVAVLVAIGSAGLSAETIDMEVTDSNITEHDGEYFAAVEVTGVRNTTVSMWPSGEREPTEYSYWVPLGMHDTHAEAQQAIDEYVADRRDSSDGE